MKIKNIVKLLDDWAPPGAAWEKDNPGLQVGNPEAEVGNILLSLDTTEEIVEEAIIKHCNVIISHHPLLYHSIKKINTSNDSTSRIISLLIKNDITLLSYHTNLDFTLGGVSHRIAELLGLQNVSFLHNSENTLSKIAVFIPESHVQLVAAAMYDAGAGNIGNYSHCSFETNGTGRFQGNNASVPVIGEKLKDEAVSETRLEAIVDNWNMKAVVDAIRRVHPYEEPAYDVYPLKNKNTRFGAGVFGVLDEALPHAEFFKLVAERLKLQAFRYAEGKSDTIKNVAVCGGAGSDLLKTAIAKNADAFITADISYHAFHDARKNILLIDAGHYETEIHILDSLDAFIKNTVIQRDSLSEVFITSHITNPIKFFK